VFVAIPENISVNETVEIDLDPNFIHFFYPSFARTFKNFELLGDAVQMLPVAIKSKIKIHLTISESDNAYARHIIANYPFSQFNFIGKRSRAEVFGYYKKMDCLLFPSKIETWGLPITEAKGFDKPILLANLPYAKESVGTYKEVSFFDPTNPAELAQLLFEFVSKTIQYQGNKYTFDLKKQYNDWYSLFDFILKE
jgi:glycosyltransferase involved in cell wall biosynthesis